ncbi:MAG TPA: hypothetical protein VGG34_05525 [Opitutaceae bacterium]
MPGQSLTTEAFVIERRPPSDAFQPLLLFCAEQGNLLAMLRVPGRPSAAHVAPDLFDEVSAILETSNQGRTWFVREIRIARRRPGIGRSYEALSAASALAAVIARNPFHEEGRAGVARALRSALDALAAGSRPDVVHLKSLFLFARDEGYPVRQEWLPSLGAADHDTAEDILARPVAGQGADPALVGRLLRSLESYLRGHTDIVLP